MIYWWCLCIKWQVHTFSGVATNRTHTTSLDPGVGHNLGGECAPALSGAEFAPDEPSHEAKEGVHDLASSCVLGAQQ